MSDKMESFEELGLKGCLNDSGVTSQNYKERIYSDVTFETADPRQGDIIFLDEDNKPILTIDRQERKIYAGEGVDITAAAQHIIDAIERLLGEKP